MTDKQALRKLIEAVEGGSACVFSLFDCVGHEGLIVDGDFHMMRATAAWKAYRGSLDAAKALHEALLPYHTSNGATGWSVELKIDYDNDLLDGPEYICEIYDGNYHCSCQNTFEAKSMHSPARAWLLAILRAYEGQQ